MQVDNDAIFWQIFDWQVAWVLRSLVCALAAGLRRLWRWLVENAGYKEKDGTQKLKQNTSVNYCLSAKEYHTHDKKMHLQHLGGICPGCNLRALLSFSPKS